MQVRQLVEPAVEQRYIWFRNIIGAAGAIIAVGSVLASYVAFQSSTLAGIAIAFVGFLATCFMFALFGLVHIFIAVEENLRRSNSMAGYTMQTTTNLTAIHDAMEDTAANLQATTEQVFAMQKNLRALAEKLDAIALYSRTTAVLIHQQHQGEQAHASNGGQPHSASAVQTAEEYYTHAEEAAPTDDSHAHEQHALVAAGATNGTHEPEQEVIQPGAPNEGSATRSSRIGLRRIGKRRGTGPLTSDEDAA